MSDPESQEARLTPTPYRILSLDGGGAKGFYTLGVLREVEAMLGGGPLCNQFNLIFGTSTGAILAALLALGRSVEQIHELYKEHVPTVMRNRTAADRSAALRNLAGSIFKGDKFDAVKTGVGIVTTRWVQETPMIFKADPAQAHGRKDTFVPGFGCTIGDAVEASCSAYPFFQRKTVTTAAGDNVELIDGGYCANNPTLYAIADALKALGLAPGDLRVLSLGVGVYPEPKPSLMMKFAKKYLVSVQLLQKTLEINTQSMEQLRKIMFKDVPTVRISDVFQRPEMATGLFEHNLDKLNALRQQGAASYAERETELRKLLQC
jgi:predicted patatin/cPLA2 family phospholipase